MSDFASEIEDRFNQIQGVRWSEFSRFLDLGVPARALVSPDLLGRARVIFQEETPYFDFADEVEAGASEATPAFVIMARDEFSEPNDLLAWAPTANRIAPWFGRAAILGAERLYAPRLLNEGALPVFETPLEWLRAERSGIVILNADRARRHLEGVSMLVAEPAFGRRIRDALRWPDPRIFVERAGRAAA